MDLKWRCVKCNAEVEFEQASDRRAVQGAVCHDRKRDRLKHPEKSGRSHFVLPGRGQTARKNPFCMGEGTEMKELIHEVKSEITQYGYKKARNSFWKIEDGFYKLINFQHGAYGDYFLSM